MIYIRSCTIIDCITLVDGDRGLGCITWTSYWRYTILVPYQWSWYLCHERTRELCTWVTNSIPTLVARTTLREFYRIHTRPKLCEPRSICMSHELYIQVTNCIPSLVAKDDFARVLLRERVIIHTSHRMYQSWPLYLRHELYIWAMNSIPTLVARTILREYYFFDHTHKSQTVWVTTFCHTHKSQTVWVTTSIYTSQTLYKSHELHTDVVGEDDFARVLSQTHVPNSASHELYLYVTNFIYE